MKKQEYNTGRRSFLRQSLLAGTGTILTLSAITACKTKSDEEEEVSPAEDLMREHGVLNRILLIYDTCKTRLANAEEFPLIAITDSAEIIRQFIEDYHEKLEEDYLFPRFEKAHQHADLVSILRQQHKAGRILTDQISSLSKLKSLTIDDNKKLTALLNTFNSMYRPHEAREDTVLFPALKKIVSKNEYDSLGEDFERKEHDLFGKDGFESMVEKVAAIEKTLGIYDLAKFTP
jgi:hemerythrin-like domain-containing protein